MSTPAFRESLRPLKETRKSPDWKERRARGEIAQETFERSRGRKASWKAK